jgi:hypothetical protein
MDDVTRRDAVKLAAAGVVLAGAGAATAQEGKRAGKEEHDVKHLGSRIEDLRKELAALAVDKDYEELLRIIHRPGWTTPAEFAFAVGLAEAMLAQTKTLAGLKQAFLKGSRAVVAK